MSSDGGGFLLRLCCTSTSCCVADALCLPLDLVKTRMQLQNELAAASAPRLGVARASGADSYSRTGARTNSVREEFVQRA